MSDEVKAATEVAKAVQEAAKTGGKAVDALRSTGGWLDRIFGRAIEDVVGRHWTDRASARRVEAAIYDWERLVTLLHKTQKRLEKKGIVATRSVPPKIALALLENATMEEEDELHTLWSNLLATCLDAGAEQVHRKHVSVLSEMTSQDARVFQTVYREWQDTDKKKWLKVAGVSYGPGIDAPRDATVSVISLNRLGLIAPSQMLVQTYKPREYVYDDEFREIREGEEVRVPGDLEVIMVTEFGEEFWRAVSD